MRIGEEGPRIRDGKRGPDQTFQEARIRPHDLPGSDTKMVRIRSQRGARIGRALHDAYKGFHFRLTKIPGESSRPWGDAILARTEICRESPRALGFSSFRFRYAFKAFGL